MAFCKYHSDIHCDECRDPNVEDQNKNLQKEIVVEEKNEKPKGATNLSGWIGLGVAMFILSGIFVLACWLTVPGFLKPDKEVAFLNFYSDYINNGNGEVWFIWQDEEIKKSVKFDDIDVALRKDGKSYTTLLLRDRTAPDSWCFKRATIFVPNLEGLEKWNDFLNELRNKYKEIQRARYEEIKKAKEAINHLSTPREVLPPIK